jgi:hypothetical protein
MLTAATLPAVKESVAALLDKNCTISGELLQRLREVGDVGVLSKLQLLKS